MNLLTGSCKEWQSKLCTQRIGHRHGKYCHFLLLILRRKVIIIEECVGGATPCVPQCSWWCMCLAVLGPVDKCNVKQFVQNRSLIDDEATPRCAPAPARSPASVTILRTPCALPSSGGRESA